MNMERNIVLGVTGSIAAYKACDLLRELMRAGCEVRVVMTDSAQKLVTPATFHSLSGNPVSISLWTPQHQANLEHIQLAEWADCMVVAPATANIIGKFAGGIADDMLSTLWLAFPGRKLIAPAMNDNMWAHEAVQRNVKILRDKQSVTVVEPAPGRLASGKMGGQGRLAPIEDIFKAVLELLSE